MLSTPPPTAPERFAAILSSLGWAVAKQTGWGLSLQLIMLIRARIRRIKIRFAALAARIAAGTYKPRKPSGKPRRKPEKPPKPPPRNPFPNRPGWLLPLEKSAISHRGQLEALFRDAEMVALMAAAPEAMEKVLRPLCRMLQLELPAVLARPPRPRVRRPEPKPRPNPAPDATRPAPAAGPAPRPGPPARPPPPRPALGLEIINGRPRLVWN